MTLSTRAEHEAAREADYVAGEVDVYPVAIAEEYVMSIEGTEEDPVKITDPKHRAREVADDVTDEATEAAACFTRHKSLAESVGEEFGNKAYDAVLDGLRGAPTVEVEG